MPSDTGLVEHAGAGPGPVTVGSVCSFSVYLQDVEISINLKDKKRQCMLQINAITFYIVINFPTVQVAIKCKNVIKSDYEIIYFSAIFPSISPKYVFML